MNKNPLQFRLGTWHKFLFYASFMSAKLHKHS